MKAQERDNARIYKSIEDDAKKTEVQIKLEEDLQKEEINRIRKEKQMCEMAKLKTEKVQKANKEKERKRREDMIKERKEAYERIIQEAVEKTGRMESQVYYYKLNRIKGTDVEKPLVARKDLNSYFSLFSSTRKNEKRSSIKRRRRYKSRERKRYKVIK